MNYIKQTKRGLFIDRIPAIKITKKVRTPFYCYSLSQLKNNFFKFKAIFGQVKPLICFAVKSNSNGILLKELKKLGSGADVVSIGELMKSLKAGIPRNKIVFSGIGKTEEELKFAINKKILLINVESESELILINKISKKLGKSTDVGIRLNPNINVSTHKKITTGKYSNKFGISNEILNKIIKQINNFKNINLVAISVHIGSQINSVKPFIKLISVLDRTIKKNNLKLKYVDLGGGIGVPYEKNEKKLNISKYAKQIFKFSKKHNCKIILEPGRLISANTAVLISKITYIKNTKNKKFVILDAGMNDFMRPALYDAKHKIFPLKNSNRKFNCAVEFVGPVCESSDKFLKVDNFTKLHENDYVCIADVGAYGSSLSSNYNLRPFIAEILVNGSKFNIIKKRQSLNSLLKQ